MPLIESGAIHPAPLILYDSGVIHPALLLERRKFRHVRSPISNLTVSNIAEYFVFPYRLSIFSISKPWGPNYVGMLGTLGAQCGAVHPRAECIREIPNESVGGSR